MDELILKVKNTKLPPLKKPKEMKNELPPIKMLPPLKEVTKQLPPLKTFPSIKTLHSDISKSQQDKILKNPFSFFSYISWEIDSPFVDFYSEKKEEYTELENDPWLKEIYETLDLRSYGNDFFQTTKILTLKLPISDKFFVYKDITFSEKLTPQIIIEKIYDFYENPDRAASVYKIKNDKRVSFQDYLYTVEKFKRDKTLEGFQIDKDKKWIPILNILS